MQTIHHTPAECLLHSLLHSDRVKSEYAISLDRSEQYTELVLWHADAFRQAQELSSPAVLCSTNKRITAQAQE